MIVRVVVCLCVSSVVAFAGPTDLVLPRTPPVLQAFKPWKMTIKAGPGAGEQTLRVDRQGGAQRGLRFEGRVLHWDAPPPGVHPVRIEVRAGRKLVRHMLHLHVHLPFAKTGVDATDLAVGPTHAVVVGTNSRGPALRILQVTGNAVRVRGRLSLGEEPRSLWVGRSKLYLLLKSGVGIVSLAASKPTIEKTLTCFGGGILEGVVELPGDRVAVLEKHGGIPRLLVGDAKADALDEGHALHGVVLPAGHRFDGRIDHLGHRLRIKAGRALIVGGAAMLTSRGEIALAVTGRLPRVDGSQPREALPLLRWGRRIDDGTLRAADGKALGGVPVRSRISGSRAMALAAHRLGVNLICRAVSLSNPAERIPQGMVFLGPADDSARHAVARLAGKLLLVAAGTRVYPVLGAPHGNARRPPMLALERLETRVRSERQQVALSIDGVPAGTPLEWVGDPVAGVTFRGTTLQLSPSGVAKGLEAAHGERMRGWNRDDARAQYQATYGHAVSGLPALIPLRLKCGSVRFDLALTIEMPEVTLDREEKVAARAKKVAEEEANAWISDHRWHQLCLFGAIILALVVVYVVVRPFVVKQEEATGLHAGGPGLNPQVILGLLLVVIGVGITIMTYQAARAGGGGTYVIAYGPVLVGAFMVLTANRG